MLVRRVDYTRRQQLQRLKCSTSCACEERQFTFRTLLPLHPERFAAAVASNIIESIDGIAWLATRHSEQAVVQTVHGIVDCQRGPPWWAVQARDEWPEGLAAELEPLWHEPYGDRQVHTIVLVSF